MTEPRKRNCMPDDHELTRMERLGIVREWLESEEAERALAKALHPKAFEFAATNDAGRHRRLDYLDQAADILVALRNLPHRAASARSGTRHDAARRRVVDGAINVLRPGRVAVSDELPFRYDDEAAPTFSGAAGRKCSRHKFEPTNDRGYTESGAPYTIWRCKCGKARDETRARRGRQSRNYGNRAELAVARKYGGDKVGHVGGPTDVRGKDFNTQVKTHRRLPPLEWTKAFAALAASRDRLPRLLLRFVGGPGKPPEDYFVFRADDFLAWFGKDEDAA